MFNNTSFFLAVICFLCSTSLWAKKESNYLYVTEINRYIDDDILKAKIHNEVKTSLDVFLIEVHLPFNSSVELIQDVRIKIKSISQQFAYVGNNNIQVTGIIDKGIADYYIKLYVRK